MHFKDDYQLRTVCGHKILSVTAGRKSADFGKFIALNDSAALLYDFFKDKDFDENDIAALLVSEYGIDAETALVDAKKFCQMLKDNGLAE